MTCPLDIHVHAPGLHRRLHSILNVNNGRGQNKNEVKPIPGETEKITKKLIF